MLRYLSSRCPRRMKLVGDDCLVTSQRRFYTPASLWNLKFAI